MPERQSGICVNDAIEPSEWMTLSGLSGSVRLPIIITLFGVGVVVVVVLVPLPAKHQSVEAWELLTHRMSRAPCRDLFGVYHFAPPRPFSFFFFVSVNTLTAALTDKLWDFIMTIFCCHFPPSVCIIFFYFWLFLPVRQNSLLGTVKLSQFRGSI